MSFEDLRKELLNSRNEIIKQIDIKYIDHIQSLLMQKYVITNQIMKQYDAKLEHLNQIKNTWKKDKAFKPKIDKKLRNHILHGWKQAIKKTLA